MAKQQRRASRSREESNPFSIAHPKQRAFLAAYAECGSITLAAKAAGVRRQTHADCWMKQDGQEGEQYRHAFLEAKEQAAETLESEARRRAVAGVDEPVIYKGQLMGLWVDRDGNRVPEGTPKAKFVPLTVKKYSDTLLMCLMNANMPHKFRMPRSGDDQRRNDPPPPLEDVLREIGAELTSKDATQ